VSKKDILLYLTTRGKTPIAEPKSPPPPPPQQPAPARLAEMHEKFTAADVERIPMTAVGQKMAQHMVQSMQTSPHVAAVHEVDMTAVVRHRADHAEEFERREGFKLSFMPYIVDAVVQAIKKYPLINSSVEGTTIIRKKFINIGVAVASDNGLIVPVVKNAEEKTFVELARAVHDLAERTRTRKLMPDDVQSGTFTISNYGVFGTLIGTPIINQPQIAILGTGVIQKRVVAVGDAIAIRSTAFFTMSFDHRVVDGLLGGMFLDQVVKNLQGIDPALKI
jgi:2-oxoglutarate dehydrogenase E2 component (dihydrolipoamide succinyltransferase)